MKLWLAAILAALIIVFLSGPKPTLVVSDERLTLPADVVGYLAANESRYADITPGAEKLVRYAAPGEPATTPLALVYLHGFSATRQETHPLTDQIADTLGANTFYTRLAGHGRGGDALSNVDGSAWFRDSREAVAIGQALGERVVLIGVSTGATLAAWQALDTPDARIAALILISPNFALADKNSRLLNLPWGLRAAELLMGEQRSFTTLNDAHGRYWTSSYKMRAAGELMALVKQVSALNPAEITQPVLYIRSDRDTVIDPVVADQFFAALGSTTKQRHIITHTDDPYGHVIAGDILSPSSTDEMHDVIVEFLRSLDAREEQ